MSVLTKIFVVLTALLSVLLVALVVPFVHNTETFKERFEDERNQRQVAAARAQNLERDLSRHLQAENEQVQALQAEAANLRSQISQLTGQLQTRQSQLVEAQRDASDVRSELARLGSGLEQAARINEMLQTEVRDRRNESLELQTRMIELSNAVRDRTTQLETLTRQVRLYREQISDLEEQNTTLRQQIEAGRVAVTDDDADVVGLGEGFVSTVPLRGRVTEVRQIGDELFIAINLGERDRVREGMQFMIHDGDQFLGNVVITRVEADSAAGRITLGPTADIAPGMQVLSGAG